MKKIISLIFLFTIHIMVVNAGPNDNILPYAIHQTKMSNGLTVVTVPYDSPGLASFYIIMRVGSRDEVDAGRTGFAHFFEHMMFRGTEKYPKEAYSNALKATGASANANTWLDRTVYHMTGNASMLDKMFELESDRFMNLKYSVQDFKTEAGAVKGEYTKNSASPYEQLDEKTNDVAFTMHTYKHTTMGFFKDVVDMPNQYDFSLQFFKNFYRPEYATILVVGDVTPDAVNKLAEKYFGIWQHGTYVNNIPVEPTQTETRYAHVKVPNFPPVVSLNYKSPAFDDSKIDMPALDLLNTILFSEKSDLFKKLVIDEQKVRDISGGASNTRDPYLSQISASLVDGKDMQYVKDEIIKAIENSKTQLVDATTLEQAKMRMKYSFAMGMDSPSSIAEALAGYIWVTGDAESLNRAYKLYEKVTPQDLMNVAKKYYVSTGLTIGTISGDESAPIK
ncbi:MAG: M16 family metallopeptidase [Bacteroidota bacterium]